MRNNTDTQVAQSSNLVARQKPGPKGGLLEPYAREVLLMAREGQSMQSIVNWLAQGPRRVVITRQAVHLWLKARIKKLVKLNAVFENTGLDQPFLERVVVSVPSSQQKESGRDPPSSVPVRLPSQPRFTPQSKVKRVDVSEFIVDVAEPGPSQNPLL